MYHKFFLLILFATPLFSMYPKWIIRNKRQKTYTHIKNAEKIYRVERIKNELKTSKRSWLRYWQYHTLVKKGLPNEIIAIILDYCAS